MKISAFNKFKVSTLARQSRGALANRAARQAGASLLEGIAYLGIAAIVVLGAVSLLTGAFSSAKSNQSTEETVALRTAVRKLYIGQTFPVGNMVGDLALANALPNTIPRSGTGAATTLTNNWGGAITIVGTANNFAITYNNVPQDVCVSMLSGANGWTTITGATEINTFPVTVAQATGTCAAGNNVIAFVAS
jgi:hypothetical protein